MNAKITTKSDQFLSQVHKQNIDFSLITIFLLLVFFSECFLTAQVPRFDKKKLAVTHI